MPPGAVSGGSDREAGPALTSVLARAARLCAGRRAEVLGVVMLAT